ncbi:VirB4 family type IV secretion system protein [Actinomadura sp. 6N118]|uniref:VirB4 family type IV secretion system protein n=1 Tax=Actinomadura sp. 6N118 TaxID=3375151 RepID=UPI0037A13550
MKPWIKFQWGPDEPARRGSLVGPAGLEITPRGLRLPDGVCATFAVTGYPAQVTPGWLEPLLSYPGQLEVALHIEPMPAALAAQRLRRQQSRLESDRRITFEHGRLQDPHVEAAVEDAAELATRLARAEGRLFRVGLYLTVHAPNDAELQAEAARVRAVAGSLLLEAQPATFRQLPGWVSCLPLGTDLLRLRRSFDTDAVAACFPFGSPDLSEPLSGTSVLYGLNLASASPVIWDRFAQENYNSVILGRSGAGKSYLAKLEILRSLINGVEVAVVDPEDEYARLAEAVGGAYVQLGGPAVRLNPFDLPAGATDQPDALTRRALFLHTLVGVLAGQPLPPRARAALDRGIVDAYQNAGICGDPRTWRRPAPMLTDLAAALTDDGDPAGAELAAQVAPYVTGTHRGMFEGATTTHPDSHLIVFSLRDLPDELRPAGHLLALDWIWRRVTNPADRRPRLVVADEAWLLMQTPEGARWLHRLAKSARKHWVGLTCITQDDQDLLGSELGRAIINNAATQILLRQAPQAIDQITEVFHLSAGEAAFLTCAATGEGLLAAGRQRVPFKALASDHDHQLITTDPAERLVSQHSSTPRAGFPAGRHDETAPGLRVVRGDS